MSPLLKVGDKIVNLDNVVQVELHGEATEYTERREYGQKRTDAVLITYRWPRRKPADEDEQVQAFFGEEAEALRVWFEMHAEDLLGTASKAKEPKKQVA